MIGKKVLAMFAVLALGAGLAASRADAGCSPRKGGIKGCKNEIKACITARGCTTLATRKEKRACKKACKLEIVTACKAPNPICSGSPSGALLDATTY